MLETIELGIGDTLTKNTHVTLVRFPCFYLASIISTGEESPELCVLLQTSTLTSLLTLRAGVTQSYSGP